MSKRIEELVSLLRVENNPIPSQILDIYGGSICDDLVDDSKAIFSEYKEELANEKLFYDNYLGLLSYINIRNTLDNPKPENRKKLYSNEFVNSVISMRTNFNYA